MRTSMNGKRGALVGAAVVAVLCGAGAPALADHDGRGARRGVGVGRVDLCDEDAGRLQIGRRIFEIGGDRPLANVVEAFRIAGYGAWSDGKRAFVRVGRERPAIAWTSGLCNAAFFYRDDCLVVSLSWADQKIERVPGWRKGEGAWRDRDRARWEFEIVKPRGGACEWISGAVAPGRAIVPVRVGGRGTGIRVSVTGR